MDRQILGFIGIVVLLASAVTVKMSKEDGKLHLFGIVGLMVSFPLMIMGLW